MKTLAIILMCSLIAFLGGLVGREMKPTEYRIIERVVPVYEVIEVEKIIQETVIVEKLVTEYVDRVVYQEPQPFRSKQEIRDWLAEADIPIEVMLDGDDAARFGGMCEDESYSMVMAAYRDGKFMSMELDTVREHYLVAVPVFKENRIYFIEPSTYEIFESYGGYDYWELD